MNELKLVRGIIHDVLYENYLLENFSHLQRSPLVLRDPTAKSLVTFIGDFFSVHGDFPSPETVRDSLAQQNNRQAVKMLEEALLQPFLKPADYSKVLTDIQSSYRRADTAATIKEAAEILQAGKTYGKTTLKGVDDCLKFILDRTTKISSAGTTARISGDIRLEAGRVKMEYLERKATPSASVGILTKLEPIDLACRGVQPGELAVICAFVGNYKTLSALNIAHDAVVTGHNVAFFSLEMAYPQVTRIIYCIHSGADVFRGKHDPLDYEKLKYGTLSPEEEDFFLNKVIPDFQKNPTYGKLFVQQAMEDPTISKIRAAAEMFNKEAPLDLIIIDYMTLMKPTQEQNFGKKADNINQIVQDLKQFAVHFDGGRSIPIISPAQTNRQGWKEAQKNDGIYDISAIAEFNAIEKAADLVWALYTDDTMRAAKEAKCTVLKMRDSRLIPPFMVYADGATKQIGSFAASNAEVGDGIADFDF